MTTITPEAVKAVADAISAEEYQPCYYAEPGETAYEHIARRALTAALPHIEAAIRTEVAREIEAESLSVNWHKTFINGLGLAARIVRGDSNE